MMSVGVVLLLAVVGVVLWLLAFRRAVIGVAKSLEPTPEEKKIGSDTADLLEAVKKQADNDNAEVSHADRDGLLTRLRGLVRGKK